MDDPDAPGGQKLVMQILGDTVLMLNGEKFGQLLASLDANLYGGPEAIRSGMIEGLYGFRAVTENDFLTNAEDENLVGALVPTNAIAVASRVLKIQNPKMYEEIGTNPGGATGTIPVAPPLFHHARRNTGTGWPTRGASPSTAKTSRRR